MFRTEKEMLEEVRRVKLELDLVTARQGILEKQYKLLKYIVSTYLTDLGAKKTAAYDDIGSITLLAPLVRAEYEEEYKEPVFEFIKKEGEPEIIKTDVHYSTFNGFIGRCIDKGSKIPRIISYTFEPSIKCNFKKEAPVPGVLQPVA